MSVQNGDVVIVQIGGVQLGAIINNAHNASADMIDSSNKDLPGVKQFIPGETGWTFSLEALFDPAAAEGFSEALGYLKAGTELTVLHGTPGSSPTSGTGLIANVETVGPKNEVSSYSLEIQGTGVASHGYGPVLNVSTCINDSYTSFSNATATGFDAVSNGAGAHEAGTADEIVFENGEQYLVEFDLVLNSGVAPYYRPRLGFAGGDMTVEGSQVATAGANAFTFTCDVGETGIISFVNSSEAGDWELTNLSVRKVL